MAKAKAKKRTPTTGVTTITAHDIAGKSSLEYRKRIEAARKGKKTVKPSSSSTGKAD
jgi:hypothetical protein